VQTLEPLWISSSGNIERIQPLQVTSATHDEMILRVRHVSKTCSVIYNEMLARPRPDYTSPNFMARRSALTDDLNFCMIGSGSNAADFFPNLIPICFNPSVAATESLRPLGPRGRMVCKDRREKFCSSTEPNQELGAWVDYHTKAHLMNVP
jgi:hypothetical protein